MNYFQLFNLPQTFALDVALLKVRYQDLLSTVHPDKFAHASQAEKMQAVVKSSQINDAFQCLKVPIRRAEHLLMLAGFVLNDEATTLQASDFLMQQMEWREQLAVIRAQGDLNDLMTFGELIQQSNKQFEAELSRLLQQSQWSSAYAVVLKLKFIIKLQQELAAIEDSLLD
jgi:molecular chaperone HscB